MVKFEYLKKIRVRWIILAILLISVWIVMGNPGLGEWYSRSIYPWVSGVLSRFSCLFPFSVGDCFIYGSIAGLLGYLSYAIMKEAEAREDIQAYRGISGMGVCLVLYRLGIELFPGRFFHSYANHLCAFFLGTFPVLLGCLHGFLERLMGSDKGDRSGGREGGGARRVSKIAYSFRPYYSRSLSSS